MKEVFLVQALSGWLRVEGSKAQKQEGPWSAGRTSYGKEQ